MSVVVPTASAACASTLFSGGRGCNLVLPRVFICFFLGFRCSWALEMWSGAT